LSNIESSKRYETERSPKQNLAEFIVLGLLTVLRWSPPALATGAENFNQFEAEMSDEFKAAGHRIC
jgi:hypothetical protein